MNVSLESVNWLAVIAAALATFFLGAVWYGVIFAKAWTTMHGYTEEKIAAMKQARPPALFFTVMLVSYLLIATVIGVLAGSAGVDSLQGGITLGLLLWVGLAVGIGLTAFIASDKPFGVYAIDFGYQLVFLLMMGAIIGAWR